MFKEAHFADVPAFKAGHYTNAQAATGCTVFFAPNGAVGAVDVRGGAPATRETDLLRPENMVEHIHAVVLSGGSAFGLEASCGVMEALAEQGIGFKLAGATVPIVCGASLFDLAVGQPTWPNKEAGTYALAQALHMKTDLEQGSVGAGTGATVGKLGTPQQAVKGGFGWAGVSQGELVVLANVAVNALGNVMAEDGSLLAGTPMGAFLHSEGGEQAARDGQTEHTGQAVANTTLGCVLTNAALTKAQATKVAQITHDAFARTIKPAHTTADGDAVFVMASGPVQVPVDQVGIAATEAMERAIRSAIRHASPTPCHPSSTPCHPERSEGSRTPCHPEAKPKDPAIG